MYLAGGLQLNCRTVPYKDGDRWELRIEMEQENLDGREVRCEVTCLQVEAAELREWLNEVVPLPNDAEKLRRENERLRHKLGEYKRHLKGLTAKHREMKLEWQGWRQAAMAADAIYAAASRHGGSIGIAEMREALKEAFAKVLRLHRRLAGIYVISHEKHVSEHQSTLEVIQSWTREFTSREPSIFTPETTWPLPCGCIYPDQHRCALFRKLERKLCECQCHSGTEFHAGRVRHGGYAPCNCGVEPGASHRHGCASLAFRIVGTEPLSRSDA